MPIRVIITEAPCADIRKANQFVDGINLQTSIADKACRVHSFCRFLSEEETDVVIPPIRRKQPSRIKYDKYLYNVRHLIENIFLHLKGLRGLVTR